MSKIRENSLWKWLNVNTKSVFKEDLQLDRVENSCMAGMADVSGTLRGCDFWIELKIGEAPKNPDLKVKVKFQEAQPGWLKKKMKAGGKAFILLQIDSGPHARRYLLPGDLAERLSNGLSEASIDSMSLIHTRAEARFILETIARNEYL